MYLKGIQIVLALCLLGPVLGLPLNAHYDSPKLAERGFTTNTVKKLSANPPAAHQAKVAQQPAIKQEESAQTAEIVSVRLPV